MAIYEGSCTCQTIRYQMHLKPLFVHGCHCRWCQRETGSAFAINGVIEASAVKLTAGEPELINTPSESGAGQLLTRCPDCKVALWSNYAGAGKKFRFVRIGTLENPDLFPPDIHIYTASKQPWVILPKDTPAVEQYYSIGQYWPKESLERRELAARSD